MRTNIQHRERGLLTTEMMTEKMIADIRSQATTLMVAVSDYDSEIVSPLLEELRETLDTARLEGVPGSMIAEILEIARQSVPEAVVTWDAILGVVAVNVWLEDSDGNRVRGETVTVDRVRWQYENTGDLLEDVIERLHDDLGIAWKVV